MNKKNNKGRHTVYTDKLANPFGVFSQAVKWVSDNEDLIFVSGQVARNVTGEVVGVGDIKAQTVQAIENLKSVLQEAGATLEDVVKVTVYITDMKNLSQVHEVRGQYWKDKYPSSTLIEVKGFVNEDFLIEIEAVAIVGHFKV